MVSVWYRIGCNEVAFKDCIIRDCTDYNVRFRNVKGVSKNWKISVGHLCGCALYKMLFNKVI